MAVFGTSDTTNRNSETAFSIASAASDSPTGVNEVSYTPDWNKWNGYYRTIDILAAVIDSKARWTVGDSFTTDEATKTKLSKIKGFGKDTFNSIMFNQLRTALICGDSFAEIIKDKAGRLINIKPINPSSMKIIIDEYGIIKRFEQISQIIKKPMQPFEPKEIFYLPYNRIADEMHGRSDIEKVEDIVKKLKELIKDNQIMIHRYIKPLTVWKVKTDDTTEVQAFKTKVDHAFEYTENLIIPDQTVAGFDNVSTPANAVLDPLPFISSLKQDITKAMGVPEIILGWGGDTTEASAKILYLSFEQMVKFHQKWLEEQIEEQLGLKINFNAPASIDPAQSGENPNNNNLKVTTLSADNKKDGGINPTK